MRKILFLLLLASQSAFAFLPAPGLWNNPSYDGQGFNIETQNNVMIVTAYVFDPAGNQIWYLAVGTYNEATSQFAGTLANATNGSCLSCTYRAPSKSGNAGGAITISFTSRETGTIFYPGGSRAISHYNYGYAGKTGYFYGEWQFSFNVAGLVDGEWVVFPGATYLSPTDGKLYAQGYLDGKQSTTAALAIYDDANAAYIVVIDDGVGYIVSYVFKGDNGRMIGLGWIEPSGTNISGNGSPAAGNRILVLSELAPGINPLSVPTERLLGLEAAIKKRTADQ